MGIDLYMLSVCLGVHVGIVVASSEFVVKQYNLFNQFEGILEH